MNGRDGINFVNDQTDNNVVTVDSCYCANNTRNGLTWSGSVNRILGGDFAGNGGWGISVGNDADTNLTEEGLISFVSIESNTLGTIYCSAKASYNIYQVQQPLLANIQSTASASCKDVMELNNAGAWTFAPASLLNTLAFTVNAPVTSTGTVTGANLTTAGTVTTPKITSNQTVNQSSSASGVFTQIASMLEDGSANTGTDLTVTTYGYVAVSFTASANDTIGSISFRLKDNGSITNPTVGELVYIYSNNLAACGGQDCPNAIIATTTGALRLGSLTGSYQVLGFPMSFTAVSGTKYWLVFKLGAAPTGADVIMDTTAVTNGGATSPSGAPSWTVGNSAAYFQVNGLTGNGLTVLSTNNYGIASTSGNGIGVYGSSVQSYGVNGTSSNNIGVYGTSANYYGVDGTSTNSVGVFGQSTGSFAVEGSSSSGVGVYGVSSSGSGGQFGTTTGTYGVQVTGKPVGVTGQTALTLTGTATGGTATCYPLVAGTAGLMYTCYLNGYSETGTAQTSTYPTAFHTTPVVLTSGNVQCVTTYPPSSTNTTLTFPANAGMTAATCEIVVIGQ